MLIQIEHAPDIIREAATSTLGVLALMVLVIATVVLIFFRGEGNRVKIPVFVMLFAGVLAFGYAIQDKAGSEVSAQEPSSAAALDAGSLTGEGEEPAPVRRGKPIRTQESNGYLVALDGCKRSGRDVTCSFLITNKEPDRQLWFNLSNTRFVDPTGNEYAGEMGQLGRQAGSGSVYNNLITDIPLRANVTFPAVPSGLRQMAVLELAFGEFTMQMRDIPVR